MIKLRKTLFVIFVIIYLIACPALILYSLGIVIKPGKKNVIKKTGIILVSSIPSGATILLNGKPLNDETPTAINNLMPGTYTLELIARKYQPWLKTVTVSAEKVTPVENVLLIPAPLNVKKLSSAPFNEFIPVPGNPYLLVTEGATLADVMIYIWDEGITQNLIPANESKTKIFKLRRIIPSGFADADARIIRLHTTQNSPYLLFEVEKEGHKKLLWIDPLFGTPKVEDITDLFPDVPSEIQWEPNNARHILTYQNNSINRLDLSTKAIYPKIIDGIDGFAQFGQDIVFVTQNKEAWRSNQSGTNQQAISNDPHFNRLVTEHFPFREIKPVSDNLTFFIGKRGDLLTTIKPYLLADRDIEGFKWNERPPRLLVWSRHAIGFIDLPRRTDITATELSGTIRWITQTANHITDAYWINDGSHILYVDDNKILLSDTGSYGAPETNEIVAIKKNSRIYYSDKTGKAFFLNQQDSHLASVEIVPQKALLPTMRLPKTQSDE